MLNMNVFIEFMKKIQKYNVEDKKKKKKNEKKNWYEKWFAMNKIFIFMRIVTYFIYIKLMYINEMMLM